MIYAKHNFKENLSNAVKYRDDKMLTSIFVQELSDLVVNSRGKVIDAVISAGIKIKSGAGDKDIVKAVIENIGSNPALSKSIWTLIIADNQASGKNGNSGNGKAYSNAIDPIGAIAEGVGNLALGIGSIFSSKQSTKQEQEKTTQAVLAAIAAKYSQPRGGSSNTAIVVASVLGIGLLLTFGIVYLKKKEK